MSSRCDCEVHCSEDRAGCAPLLLLFCSVDGAVSKHQGAEDVEQLWGVLLTYGLQKGPANLETAMEEGAKAIPYTRCAGLELGSNLLPASYLSCILTMAFL